MKHIAHMTAKPEKYELESRIARLHQALGQGWDAAFLIDKVNHYYFTGTMQDGLFVLKNDGSYAYFARRSFERAKEECLIDNVYPMKSYKDVMEKMGDAATVMLETEVITYAAVQRLKKYFTMSDVKPVGHAVSQTRAVKSAYELAWVRESGRQHKELFETVIPGLLKEGMSESELTAAMYKEMIALGYQGIARFASFQTDIVVGQIGFGENSLYPTSFDGPGGMKGLCAAAPIVGDRDKLLKKGDLVFVDVGYGTNGYHTDRTQLYMFGASPSEDVLAVYNKCMDIQKQTASMLKPGAIPSEIYNTVMGGLDEGFLQNFMGFGQRSVKFLGHGVGLHIDEYPAIANGFNEPLAANMVMAVEPKKGVAGVGLVGSEDTYIVTENGGECVTGGEKDIFII